MGIAVKPSFHPTHARGMCVLLTFCAIFYCEPFFALAHAKESRNRGKCVSADGNLIRAFDAAGRKTENFYDAQGRCAGPSSSVAEKRRGIEVRMRSGFDTEGSRGAPSGPGPGKIAGHGPCRNGS